MNSQDITTMYFVRHGEVHNPQRVVYERLPGFHLSAQGRAQVMRSARFLSRDENARAAVALYSSPLERTYETAEIISQILAQTTGKTLVIQKDDRLIEAENSFRGQRVGHGKASPLRVGNWRKYLDLGTPGWGESYKKIADRMVSFTKEKAQEYRGKSIIVVSHESPIWTLRAMLSTGKPQTSILKRQQALASITRICIDVREHRLVSIDYVDLNVSRQWKASYRAH